MTLEQFVLDHSEIIVAVLFALSEAMPKLTKGKANGVLSALIKSSKFSGAFVKSYAKRRRKK